MTLWFRRGMGSRPSRNHPDARCCARNVIKNGEFLLGYVNDYGKLAELRRLKRRRSPKRPLRFAA